MIHQKEYTTIVGPDDKKKKRGGASFKIFSGIAATFALASGGYHLLHSNDAVGSSNFDMSLISTTEIVQEKGSIGRGFVGKYMYTYDDTVSNNCETVLMIGVGTAMKSTQYTILSKAISTGTSIVTVIFDPNPGSIVKLSPKDYANFYNTFTTPDLGARLPVCQGKSPKIIIGGHSASGRAGLQAMMHEGVKPDGFVGLDPYQASKEEIKGIGPRGAPATSIRPDLPMLLWGFEKTTCGIKIDLAAKSAYELSGVKNRVFFRANNSNNRNVRHCEFADRGCAVACPNSKPNNNVKDIVAQSIQVFATSVLKGGSIRPSDFHFDTSNDSVLIDVFIDSDTVQ
mmetsp:Transcript_13056/g.13991  ORF Transcript_13056/g.13991 Transcript_13056/m.13991 type:complete len:341 (+) Transcript_13056:69-1091(+)